MHIRTKKWARPELEACKFYIDDGEPVRDHWLAAFSHPENPLHIELGCGKGVSTAQMIAANPGINYVAADISRDVLGDARRNTVRECGGDPDHAFLLHTEITEISRVFGPEDVTERIYINFCNPWTMRPKHAKRRLTHPRQLMQYRTFLRDGGEIWFKTDDDLLFEDSLVYFDLCGFEIAYLTMDLHADGFQPNYLSEHEIKYTEMGVPIKFGIFRKKTEAPDFDPTRYRLTPGERARALARLRPEAEKAGDGQG